MFTQFISNKFLISPSYLDQVLRTSFSIIASNSKLLRSFKELIENSRLNVGYIGNQNQELHKYIKTSEYDQHIVFMKPSQSFMTHSSPENLKKIGQVYVIILGSSLPVDLVGFLQEFKVSGFIGTAELNLITLNQILEDILLKGYTANYHIPEEYWKNKPKHEFPRPKPTLTNAENEVLILLCHNYSVKQISEKLHKKEPAIRFQIANLREKLHAQSLLEIVVITMANSWVVINGEKTSSESPFLAPFIKKNAKKVN
tara:strand:+ start:81438 stop:82208 length:771 start_codon:yes stop_codon:yes gene_type:complete